MAKTRFYQTKDLLKETFSLIESSEEEYKKFLDFSSKHYKYTFQDIILIYNQRPNATAVTDMSTWNSIFARRVNRGTQSIAVFDSNSNTGLNYLFDVGDTNGQTPPVHWKYEKQHESELKKTFYEKIFATKATTDLEYEYIGDIIDTKIINDCSKYIDDIYKNVDDSPLESQDRSLVESKFVCAVVDSVGEIIQSRTGITCKGFIEDGLTLGAISDFNTQALRAMVHTAINEISKDTLLTIERSIKHQEKQKLVSERSEENDLHTNRRSIETEHTDSRELQTPFPAGEIRENGAGLSGGAEPIPSDSDADGRNAGADISQGGHRIKSNDERLDGIDAEARPIDESSGYNGNDKAQSDDPDASRGDSASRDSLSDEIMQPKEAVNDTASFLLSKNEYQSQNDIDNAKEDELKDIEQTLLHGSGFVEGKQRIVDFLSEDHTSAEKNSFFKNEYGIGGWSDTFSNDYHGYTNHDGKGIEIFNNGFDNPSIKLSYSKVAKGIESLIGNGKYFEKQHQHEVPPVRRNQESTLLNYVDTDISLKDYGYLYERIEKVSNDEALTMFDSGDELFLLYEDNTESLVENKQSLIKHIENGGLVGREISVVSEIANKTTIAATPLSPLAEEVIQNQVGTPIDANTESINFDKLPANKQIYQRLKSLAPHLFDGRYDYQKMSTAGFIDLNIEKLTSDRMAISHNFIQNGDVMADPDMELIIDHENEEINPFSYQNDALGIYQNILDTDGDYIAPIGNNLPSFLVEWLRNVEQQGHVTSKAVYSFESESNPQFDSQGRELGFDVPHLKYDYSFNDDFIVPNGQKTRFNINVDAIKLLKQIESEGRMAMPEEQSVLSHYVGWGGIPNAFDDTKPDWASEYYELKDLLSTEEYTHARASTLNAHYTSPLIIDSMYQALLNFGFNGGKILEPAMGTGNFFGAMPPAMRNKSNLSGVELDIITGAIATQLYQSADIKIQGFEKTNFKDNSFDVVVGNVPFGSYKIKYKLIHDFFIDNSIDKARIGGIVAVITSKGTMDKVNTAFRESIANKAELIGAIRLPNTAFKQSAGTSVTSDILFFKRLEKPPAQIPSWVMLNKTVDGIPVNAYYTENPHMLLGNMAYSNSMYGKETDTTLEPFENADLEKQLNQAILHLSTDISPTLDDINMQDNEFEQLSLSAQDYPQVKNFSYTNIDDNIYYRENDDLLKQDLSPTHLARINDMIGLRSAVRKIINVQVDSGTKEEFEQAKETLNTTYDNFVGTHGNLSSRGVSNVCRQDADYPLLSSLEVINDEKEISKADIFFKPTIKPNIPIEHVSTSVEALNVSKNIKGKVDIEYMASLMDQSADVIVADLEGIIFRNPLQFDADNPYQNFETAEQYLSGNVRAKLDIAKAYTKNDDRFNINVKSLEAIQPKDLTADQIDLRIGSTWIPEKYYLDFIKETLEPTSNYLRLEYSNELDRYVLENKSIYSNSFKATNAYGTHRMHAYELFEQTLNLKKPKIVDYDEDRKAHFNAKETFAIREKQDLLLSEFNDWIFKDPDRRNELVEMYNDNFNNIRVATYDGSYLTLPNMNPEIELKPHQKDAIARSLFERNVLYAHEVGAGKTFVMIGSTMEMKRLGLINKAMITVPNHLVKQTGSEFMKLYPSANILLATKQDFQKQNRQRLVSKIVTGDYDAIIIAHSTFARIGVSPDRMESLINKQIYDFQLAIENSDYRSTVKMLETQKKRLHEQLDKLLSGNRDNQVYFEELGIDSLVVDEAHNFKNLHIATKMTGVAGVPTSASKKASDMFAKIEITKEQGGRVIFATGTPITNSLGEMYTMQRYLQSDELEKRGLQTFDRWVSTFGEVQTTMEVGIDNSSIKSKERLAKFKNLPEMMNMYRMVADIQTQETLNLPRPKLKTGKPIIIVAKPSQELLDKNVEFTGRNENIKDGSVDPRDDNALKITYEGRAIATDLRLLDPNANDYEYSKVNLLVRNVFDIWQETSKDRLTQMIFSDLGTPGGKSFNLYQDIKDKLINLGVPEDEVAFIHDANTDNQKEALFRDVRSGNVRVLLGSTQKMGTGTNCQKKLVALHELDCPWRAADVAQREGRILRQGNDNEEVAIYRYVTEKSFDAYNWNLVEAKHKFFIQIMNGSDTSTRTADNIDEVGLNYAEIKALASGNPLLKDKAMIDVEVSRLAILKQQYNANQYRLQDSIAIHLPKRIAQLDENIELWQADIMKRNENNIEPFKITLKSIEYDDKADAAYMLQGYISSLPFNGSQVSIGSYRGFELTGEKSLDFHQNRITLEGSADHLVVLGSSGSGNLTRIDNMINGFDEKVSGGLNDLEMYKDEIESAKTELAKPFKHGDKLKEMLSKQRDINHKLGFDNVKVDEIGVEVEHEIENGQESENDLER